MLAYGIDICAIPEESWGFAVRALPPKDIFVDKDHAIFDAAVVFLDVNAKVFFEIIPRCL